MHKFSQYELGDTFFRQFYRMPTYIIFKISSKFKLFCAILSFYSYKLYSTLLENCLSLFLKNYFLNSLIKCSEGISKYFTLSVWLKKKTTNNVVNVIIIILYRNCKLKFFKFIKSSTNHRRIKLFYIYKA